MSKTYKPKPVVQVELSHEVIEDSVDVVETVADVVVEPPKASGSYIVAEGDTYASLGKKLAPGGVSGFEMAKRLLAANGGKPLIAGDKLNG